MKYAGLGDHSCPVYRKLIEGYWIKSELASHSTQEGLFGICELILYLIDTIQEDVKGVVRYKAQFRALLAQILGIRPMIEMIESFLAYGINEFAQKLAKQNLLKLTKLLKEARKHIVLRHTQKTGFKNIGFTRSLTQITKSMSHLASKFQKVIGELHSIFSSDCIDHDPSNQIEGWDNEGCNVAPVYDVSFYNQIDFCSIDFESIYREQLKLRKEKEDANKAINHVSTLLEDAENLTELGKLEEANEKLLSIESGNNLGSLPANDYASFTLLKAKVNAKLQHHDEAKKALEDISKNGVLSSCILDDEVFKNVFQTAELDNIREHWNSHLTGKQKQNFHSLHQFL